MKEIKLKSANFIYLIFGLISLGILVYIISTIINMLFNDKFKYEMIIFIIPLLFLSAISFVLLKAFYNRKEFSVYILEKKIIDYSILYNSYVEIESDKDWLFLIKKEDMEYFIDVVWRY